MSNTATIPSSPPNSAAREDVFWTWTRIAMVCVLAFIVMGLAAMFGIYTSWFNSGKIVPGLVVQGENLSGLTQDEAKARLEKRFGRLFVLLKTPERDFNVSLSQLGGTIMTDRAVNDAYWYGRNRGTLTNAINYWTSRQMEERRMLPIRWNKNQLRNTVWTVAGIYNQPARNAKLSVTPHGIEIMAEQNGRALNVGATCATLQEKYFPGKPQINATTRSTAPTLLAAGLAGHDVELDRYVTRFNPGERGRTENVRLAAEAVNGVVLMPGQSFSFNSTTGERKTSKGYQVAHIFVRKPGETESEIVDGVGGGVCQVSSTLYNAVRKTNQKVDGGLKIIERNNHSLPVSYVPSGMDATVAWPHKDFRFRNTLSHPIYLRAEMGTRRLNISVWARVPDDVQSVIVPEETTTASREEGETPL